MRKVKTDAPRFRANGAVAQHCAHQARFLSHENVRHVGVGAPMHSNRSIQSDNIASRVGRYVYFLGAGAAAD